VPAITYLVPLLLFAALILSGSLQGLAVSGHFPRRRKGSASGSGTITLFGSMALTIAALIGGTATALHVVPWYAAVIGAGCALLAAPPVLSLFPDRFVDGRGAPLAFAAFSAALALLIARW
jgi:hypothetical protein